jgi:hypothetical protein
MTTYKLTKKFFKELPAGVWLVSNCNSPHTNVPLFEDYVLTGRNERERQWERIKDADADQRNCHVFGSVEEYKKSDLHIFPRLAKLGGNP